MYQESYGSIKAIGWKLIDGSGLNFGTLFDANVADGDDMPLPYLADGRMNPEYDEAIIWDE